MKTKIAILIAVMAAAASAYSAEPMPIMSARANIGLNNNSLVAGFVIEFGSLGHTIIRGLGPTLASYFPPGTQMLSNPVLSVYDPNGNLLATQHSWNELPQNQKNFLAAYGLRPISNNECAIFLELNPSFQPHTAILTSEGGPTGIGLVDVYNY